MWVRIAQSVQQLAMGWTVRGSNPGGGRGARLSSTVQTSLLYNGYQVFLGCKVARAFALTTHPQIALRLKKEQSYTSTPPLAFMACYRVNFTFTFYKETIKDISLKYNYTRNNRRLLMNTKDKNSYGDTQMNIPKCQIDTYHNMTKIYI